MNACSPSSSHVCWTQPSMTIRQITIVGTGLIGGSLALALHRQEFPGTILGCDKPDVLEQALTTGAIDRGISDLNQATQKSDIVVLATPVGAILSLFEKIAPSLPATTLITDTGSTKEQFVERARMVLGEAAAERL